MQEPISDTLGTGVGMPVWVRCKHGRMGDESCATCKLERELAAANARIGELEREAVRLVPCSANKEVDRDE